MLLVMESNFSSFAEERSYFVHLLDGLTFLRLYSRAELASDLSIDRSNLTRILKGRYIPSADLWFRIKYFILSR